MKPGWLTLTACFSVWLVAGSVEAQWARCASDMDQLRVASEQAHEAFARLASLQVDVENRDADFRRCQQDLRQYRIDIQRGATIPGVISTDGCRRQELSYQTAERQYATTFGGIQPAVDAVLAAAQMVESSCGFSFTVARRRDEPETHSPQCQAFLRDRPGVPLATLRVICPSAMSDADCRLCVGEPQE